MAKLDKIIEINGTPYEVNAVQADNATQVSESLTLHNKKTPTSNTTVIFDYNGAEKKSIQIVPASGGTFTGPIYNVVSSSSDSDPRRILNQGEINTKIQALTGLPAWKWEDGQLTSLNSDNPSVSNLDIIFGASIDAVTFFNHNKDSGNLDCCLYITNSGLVGMIFLITKEDIVLLGDYASNATNAYKADELYDKVSEQAHTVASINSEFNQVRIQLETLNTALYGKDGTAESINGGLAKTLQEAFNTLDDKLTELVIGLQDGDIIVKAAQQANTAVKAHTDRLNNVINTYYQKKISVIHADDPEPEGTDGDILIVIP